MVKQISLDTWSVHHLQELMIKATNFISQTKTPIVLYRETLEEKEAHLFYFIVKNNFNDFNFSNPSLMFFLISLDVSS